MGLYSACPEHDALLREGICHSREYIDIYHRLSDECRDAMTDKDQLLFVADPEAEERWKKAHSRKAREHVWNCKHPACVKVLKYVSDRTEDGGN